MTTSTVRPPSSPPGQAIDTTPSHGHEPGHARGAATSLPFLLGSVLLLLFTWEIRLHTFALSELGLDGALSMDLAVSPISDMLRFNALDVHPPLFYIILKGWYSLAGINFYTAKYLVVALSTLGTACLVSLGRTLITPSTGVLAGLLFALAPTNVLLGPAVRDYTPGMAASLLTLVLVIQIRGPGTWQRTRLIAAGAAGIAVANATALLTWYFHPVFLALSAGSLLARGARHRRATAAALLVGCALAVPWYAYAIPRLLAKVSSGTTAYGGPPSLPTVGSLIAPMAHGLGGAMPRGWPEAWSLVLWTMSLVLGVYASRPWLGRPWAPTRNHRRLPDAEAPLPPTRTVREPSRSERQPTQEAAFGARGTLGARMAAPRVWQTAVGGLVLSTVFVLALTARWNVPNDLGRYSLVLVPFAALLQASGPTLSTGRRRWIALAPVACLVISQFVAYERLATGTPINWDHDDAVQYVRDHMRQGDAVIFSDRARRLRFLLRPHSGVGAYVIHTAGQRYLQAHAREDTERVLAEALPTAHRLWYINAAEPAGSPPVVREALAMRTYLIEQKEIEGANITLWAVGTPGTAVAPSAAFGQLATLDGAAYSAKASAGGILLVDLIWQPIAPSTQPFTVFVHVEDQRGATVAQHDSQPVAELRPTTGWVAGHSIDDRHGVALPPQLAPGAYKLVVGLYRGDTRLSLPDGSNQLVLGVVTVEP